MLKLNSVRREYYCANRIVCLNGIPKHDNQVPYLNPFLVYVSTSREQTQSRTTILTILFPQSSRTELVLAQLNPKLSCGYRHNIYIQQYIADTILLVFIRSSSLPLLFFFSKKEDNRIRAVYVYMCAYASSTENNIF